MEKLNYTIIFSNRKTLTLSVSKNLEVIVKAPKKTSEKHIQSFVDKHNDWILNQISAIKSRPTLSPEEIAILKIKARSLIPEKVAHFEKIMGVSSTGVKITSANTRWGSCSYKNSLCFSYKIMLLPDSLIDYIVVHELAHIIEKNHSAKFYKVVEKYLPDYKTRVKKLKEIGRGI